MCELYVAIIIVSYRKQTGCDHVIVEGTLSLGTRLTRGAPLVRWYVQVHGGHHDNGRQPGRTEAF